jgi:putative ABC transport system permease protein
MPQPQASGPFRARDPLPLRICLAVVRLIGAVVPSSSRVDWRAEWEAEVRYYWQDLESRNGLDWRSRMDLFRRALGALPDAAWLRRQFTADADAVHDLKHGVRMLIKSPSFTLSAVFILALGIGGTVSIVALLDTLFFRPLPYQDADRIVTVWQRHSSRPSELDDVAPANFLDWRSKARSFSKIAGMVPYSRDYTGGVEPEVLFGAQVTEGFFDAIGMAPALGRSFLPEEHVTGARRVVIISHGLWKSRFAADPAIVNKAISLDGEPWTIVGVLPSTFEPQLLPRPGDLSVWTPKVIQEFENRIRASAWWNVVARLAPGVTIEQAQRELDAISIELGRAYPRTNAGTSARLVAMREHLMGGVSLPLFLMLAAVVLVLGIGCANVASLLLARGIERNREFAIRSALGAGRVRLVRQLVAESLLLSLLAATVGVALAHVALRALIAIAPAGILRLQDSAIDLRILAFAGVLTVVTTIVFGLIPATHFSRGGRDALRERSSEGPRGTLRRGLVAAEVAIALVLLIGAGLLVRSFARLLSVDPGFAADRVVMAQVFVADRHSTPEAVRLFFSATLGRMQALPGVEAAGAVSAMPFALSNIDIRSELAVIGRPPAAAGEQAGVFLTIATPGYFRAMSIPLREGRHLDERDDERAPRIAVISDALRRREWPNDSPIGQRARVLWLGNPIELEIVGVVNQIRHDGLDTAPRPEVFIPHAQLPFTSMTYVVKAAGDPASLIDRVKQQIWAVDRLQAVYDSASVARLVDASVVRQRFSMTVMAVFGLLALILCASGIYGIVSFTTTQRTREIGLRMALGADAATIRRMVLREGSIVVVVGLVAGVLAAAVGARFLRTLLFEVQPTDPLTYSAVSVILLLVGLAACYVPATRATRVDPLVALRNE